MYTRQVIDANNIIKNYYYVDLKAENSIYSLNGDYEIILHYSTNGKSTYSENFTIDKMRIADLGIDAITKTDKGTYEVSQSISFNNSQIINRDFRFRFNRKDSGASIFVYYDKIELDNTTEYDNLLELANDKQGITTKFVVDGIEEHIGI